MTPVEVEAAKEGVTVGEVSGSMFGDDFVGISEAPKGLQKQRGKALEHSRKMESDGECENVRSSCM